MYNKQEWGKGLKWDNHFLILSVDFELVYLLSSLPTLVFSYELIECTWKWRSESTVYETKCIWNDDGDQQA